METQTQEKKAALREAEAGLEQARARLEQSRAEAEFAGINFRRLKFIHDRDADVLPQQDVDQVRANQGVAFGKQKSAETEVHAAETAIAAAKARLETIETLMRYSILRAPISGVVTRRFVDPGALIRVASASRTQTAPVVTIAQLDRLRIFVDAPEPSSPFVHVGTPAVVDLSTLPNEKVETPVTRISEVLDPGSRTLRVEIDIENPKSHLRPGMTARVSLMLRDLRGTVTVPVNAVRREGNTRTIYVLDGDRARAVRVTTGIESPEWIQIRTGLEGGEKVITSAAGELKEGVRVRVRS
jgi:membrane fusion protein, multidrug efflux system